MKSIYAFFVAYCLGFASVFGQHETIKWQTTPIEIDGKKSDWAEKLQFTNAATKVLYEFRNDDKNLYLMYEIPSERNQIKMMVGGFNIDFSTKVKPKLKASIKFPILEDIIFEMKPGTRPDILRYKNIYLLKNEPAKLKGFKFSAGSVHSGDIDMESVSYAFRWDSANVLRYELSIPLKDLFGAGYKLDEIKDNELVIEAKLAAIVRPEMPEGMQGASGSNAGRRPQMGRTPGAQTGGSPAGSGQGEMLTLFEDQFIVQKLKLSTKTD